MGGLAGEHLVEHTGERVHIRTTGDFFLRRRLLG